MNLTPSPNRAELAAIVSARFADLEQGLQLLPIATDPLIGLAITRLREASLWAHAALCNAPPVVVPGEAAGEPDREF